MTGVSWWQYIWKSVVLPVPVTPAEDLLKIQSADDYQKSFTFLDAWTDDERPNTIIHSSASLGLSLTQTFVWAGSSGSYRPLTITYS